MVDRDDTAILEEGRIEAGSFFGLRVEPEKGGNFSADMVHGAAPSLGLRCSAARRSCWFGGTAS